MKKGYSPPCTECAELRRVCRKLGIRMQSSPICSECYDKNLDTWLYDGNRQHKKNKWTKKKGLDNDEL